MAYRLTEVELSRELSPIVLADETGWGLFARWNDQLVGFAMLERTSSATLSSVDLARLADVRFSTEILMAKADSELGDLWPQAQPLPSLSVVICTKDRPLRLARLLASLAAARSTSLFSSLEIVVVDNASVDTRTRDTAASIAGVDYVFEPKAGLNFARNTALQAATGELIAYLDDDVVIDRHWFHGLATAWLSNPVAGGFTGLVLPYRLDTDAQVMFEQRGGFGRGFCRREFRRSSFAYPLHPVGAGLLGAGCNMAFNRRLLIDIGGFDDALDTGAPLPGGGDLDIFYRVLRSGRAMVYEPRYAVYHEHRETIAQLRRQYWTWGLGMMAFLEKSQRADPDLRPKHRDMVRWWLLDQTKLALLAAVRWKGQELRFHLAELSGGIRGLCGEYERSRARITAIRAVQP